MIIKNGIVADPASGLYEQMDILVKDGKIVKIAPDISCASDAAATEKEEIIDASGMIVGPGLIDTHVHFRDPGFTIFHPPDMVPSEMAVKQENADRKSVV